MTCTPVKRHLDRDRGEITERYRVKTVLLSQREGPTQTSPSQPPWIQSGLHLDLRFWPPESGRQSISVTQVCGTLLGSQSYDGSCLHPSWRILRTNWTALPLSLDALTVSQALSTWHHIASIPPQGRIWSLHLISCMPINCCFKAKSRLPLIPVNKVFAVTLSWCCDWPFYFREWSWRPVQNTAGPPKPGAYTGWAIPGSVDPLCTHSFLGIKF